MTLSDLRTLTLQFLDDPQAGYFTVAAVNVWLNNAHREVQKLLLMAGNNWYIREQQTQTVINQNLYVLPSDFREVHRLEIVITGTPPNESKSIIFPITYNQQDYNAAATGTPESYVLRKNTIQLFPVPDGVKTLRLHYSYMVADMVLDSDTPDVPVQYQEMIAIMAALDGGIKDKTDLTGILAKKSFYEAMLKSDATLRQPDRPRTVVITEDDGFGRMF